MSDPEPGTRARADVLGAGLRAALALGLVGLIAGFLWGIADVPTYTATATVIVPGDGGGEADPAELDRIAALGESEKVATAAAALLGGDVAGGDLLSDVTVVASSARGGVVIRARSDSPDISAATANGYAEALADAGGKGLEAGAAATPPDSPTSNRSAVLTSAVGLIAGLLLGGLVALLLGRRGPSLGEPGRRPEPAAAEPTPGLSRIRRRRERAAREPALPLLETPLEAGALLGRSAGELRLDPGAVEVFEDLLARTGAGEEDGPESLAVMQPGGAGGAVAGAAALALGVAAAEHGLGVIVVEADLAHPLLADLADVPGSPGLANYLAGEAGPRDVLRSVRSGAPRPLVCLPAGRAGADLEPLLEGRRFESLLRRLPRVYDLVVISAPSPRESPGAAVAGLAGGVVLVGAGEEGREALAEAGAGGRSDRPLAGLVVASGSPQERAQGALPRS